MSDYLNKRLIISVVVALVVVGVLIGVLATVTGSFSSPPAPAPVSYEDGYRDAGSPDYTCDDPQQVYNELRAMGWSESDAQSSVYAGQAAGKVCSG